MYREKKTNSGYIRNRLEEENEELKEKKFICLLWWHSWTLARRGRLYWNLDETRR
jgi:hypothetical protein